MSSKNIKDMTTNELRTFAHNNTPHLLTELAVKDILSGKRDYTLLMRLTEVNDQGISYLFNDGIAEKDGCYKLIHIEDKNFFVVKGEISATYININDEINTIFLFKIFELEEDHNLDLVRLVNNFNRQTHFSKFTSHKASIQLAIALSYQQGLWITKLYEDLMLLEMEAKRCAGFLNDENISYS